MKIQNEKDDFIEILRLANVAGSEAAEYIVNKTEMIKKISLNQLENGSANIILKKNGIIHELFKKYSTNNKLENCELIESNEITLIVKYNFHNRNKKEITLCALNAVKHVLSSLEETIIST